MFKVEQRVSSIASQIRNAYIDFSKMTVSVVRVSATVDGGTVTGYGFNSNGRYAQAGLLKERFIPRLEALSEKDALDDSISPPKIWQQLMKNEKPGGHGERSVAVGVLDMALWDIAAKLEQKPLYRLLAERYGATPDTHVFVYAAGGYYYPGKDIQQLRDEIRSYLDTGYSVVKIKIGGASLKEDVNRIEAVLELVGEGQNLAVDANGRFNLDTALEYARALAPYNLRWFEEAGDPLDYRLQAVLAEHYAPPLATGENLFSHQDSRNLLRYGGLRSDRDVLQMDPALGYGLSEYLRTLGVLREQGWSPRRCIPHGGHQFALGMAAGLGLGGNEAYPQVFRPFGGLSDTLAVENSRVSLPDAPGIGIETNAALIDHVKALFH